MKLITIYTVKSNAIFISGQFYAWVANESVSVAAYRISQELQWVPVIFVPGSSNGLVKSGNRPSYEPISHQDQVRNTVAPIFA